MGSFLIGYMEVRHSLLYYVLLLLSIILIVIIWMFTDMKNSESSINLFIEALNAIKNIAGIYFRN